MLELGNDLSFGAVVRCQVDFVTTEEIAALAGFRALQRGPQFNRRYPGISGAGGLFRIDLCFLAEPDGHSDDSNQRKQADGQQDDGQVDHHATGNGHTFGELGPKATKLPETWLFNSPAFRIARL